MPIKTKASIKGFFTRGDTPTSAEFSDLVSTFIAIRAPGSALQTGLYEIESTASTTAVGLTTYTRSMLTNISTTAQMQDWIAFTSASGAGGGAFGEDWLNAAVTADGLNLLGPGIASNILVSAGDILYTDGSGLQRLAIGGTGQSLFVNGSGNAPAWTTPTPTLGSAQSSSSGNTIDFTGIPANVKRITINLAGISLNGSANFLFQIGDSGGIETTGYVSSSVISVASGGNSAAVTSTTGYVLQGINAGTFSGRVVLELVDPSTNQWTCTIVGGYSTNNLVNTYGLKTLTGALDRVRLTTTSGGVDYDAGDVNIIYE